MRWKGSGNLALREILVIDDLDGVSFDEPVKAVYINGDYVADIGDIGDEVVWTPGKYWGKYVNRSVSQVGNVAFLLGVIAIGAFVLPRMVANGINGINEIKNAWKVEW